MLELTLRRGGPDDAGDVLALFDGAVAWLVERGQSGQWGSEPWSARPRAVAHARDLARERGVGLLRVDCWTGAPALVAFYEAQGFTRSGAFAVGDWRGQVLSLRAVGNT